MAYKTDIKGWMFEEELQVIEQLSKAPAKGGVIVEVGSFCGKSSIAWAMNADPSVTIYCLDIFYEHIQDNNGEFCNTWEEFQRNTAEFKNVIAQRGHVPQETPYTDDRPIDIFFMDASHNNPNDWEIIEYFLPKVKSGGVIAGHDYTPYLDRRDIAFPDVNLNVHTLEEMFNQKAKVIRTFWYLIKP